MQLETILKLFQTYIFLPFKYEIKDFSKIFCLHFISPLKPSSIIALKLITVNQVLTKCPKSYEQLHAVLYLFYSHTILGVK